MTHCVFRGNFGIVGGGLAGLVAAHEATNRGRSVILVDQEGPQSLGGQAFWSLGGLFMVNTPEQRRMGIRDSHELALSDWMGSAGFDRPEDHWPRAWATPALQARTKRCGVWLCKTVIPETMFSSVRSW